MCKHDTSCADCQEIIGSTVNVEPRSDRGSVIEPPPGFEECEHEDWLYNAVTQEYFSKKTGALAWLNAGMFCPIRRSGHEINMYKV